MAYAGGEVGAWQAKLRPKLAGLLGETPAPRVDLHAHRQWARQTELGAIEKIVFTSEPYCDVPAYVCIPHDFPEPHTWMICVQGHETCMHNSIGVEYDDETTPIEIVDDRDFALGCMRHGVAALCIEQRAFGLREEQAMSGHAGVRCHDATMHALMLGRTMLGERVFDVDRAIDYLATRADVDPARIGVMGNSGGGTTSVFTAATLPRVSFAMPSCYFCTFRDSILSINHCMDNYVPGLLRYAEMADVLGLFAPKPVVIVAGSADEIFPIAGTQRAFVDLQRIYAAAGAGDRCRLVIGAGGHRFYADDAWPVLEAELARL
jgi:dienelactone hydrolase